MDYQKEYTETLQRYEEKLGPLPEEVEFLYGTVDLTRMMLRALKRNKPIAKPGEPEFVCL